MNGEPPLVVRPAHPADADAISALTAAVQELHAGARPDVFRPAGPDTFPPALVRELMAEPDRLFLVAVAGGVVVGHAYAEVQRQPATTFKHAAERLYVHQMAVAAGHRGLGIGTRLLAAVREAARARGLRTISLDVYAFNAGARRLYEREGFAPERTYLSHRPAD